MDDVNGELVLAVEGDLVDSSPVGAKRADRRHELCETKDGGISGVAIDLAFGQWLRDSGGVKLGCVADGAKVGQRAEDLALLVQVRSIFGIADLLADKVVCNRHFVLSQSAGLVGADDVDSSQCFHGLQALAKDFVLLHDVGGDGQTCCDCDWKAFGDECHSDADAVDDEYWYRDPVGMLTA